MRFSVSRSYALFAGSPLVSAVGRYSDIDRDLEYWYDRFAKNNSISLADAKKMLTTKELSEFRWDVKEYIKHGKENTADGRWIKQLENASARYHVSRLEALQLRTQQAMEVAFGNQLDSVDHMARRVLTENYYQSIFEVQRGFNIGWNVGQIDERTFNKLVVKPWAGDGKNFSDRIWAKKNEMINALQEELTRGCIYGRPLDETIARMEQFVDKKFKNAKYAARRIVVTESAYFRVLGTRDELAEIGVEEFQVDLPIDDKTCEICREMNGRIFPMSEFAVGLNAPPFHPNCENGSIIPVTDEGFEEGLTNDGKSGIIKADESYTTKLRQGQDKEMGEKTDEVISAQSVLNKQKTRSIIKRGIAEKEPIFADGLLGKLAHFFKREDGYFDVTMHGSSQTADFFGEKIDSHTLARILKGRADYHGEPIRLLSCNTGKQESDTDCFAQRLANELKIPVKAPNNFLWAHPVKNGVSEITIGTTAIENDGEFVDFQPHFK